MTPGGHFDMFEAMAGIQAGPRQAEETRSMAARYGTEIVGPTLRVRLGLEQPAPQALGSSPG